MDKNNKTLLIAVLIMLLALVALNFNSISGKSTTGGSVVVSASPSVVKVPGYVDLYVNSYDIRVDSKVYMYEASGERVGWVVDNFCPGTTCKGEFTKQFYIPRGVEPGRYYIKITGSQSRGGEWDSNMFSVIEG